MRKPRVLIRLLATLLVVVAGSAVVGRAANLGGTSHTIGAGTASIVPCATVGITMTETGGATITSITLTNIPAACGGAALVATFNNNAAATSTASGTVPAGGGSMTLTLSASIALTDASQVDIVMTGT